MLCGVGGEVSPTSTPALGDSGWSRCKLSSRPAGMEAPKAPLWVHLRANGSHCTNRRPHGQLGTAPKPQTSTQGPIIAPKGPQTSRQGPITAPKGPTTAPKGPSPPHRAP